MIPSPFLVYESLLDTIDLDEEYFKPLTDEDIKTYSMHLSFRRSAYLPIPIGLERGGSMSSIDTYKKRRAKFSFESFKHHKLAGELHATRKVRILSN